MPKTSKLVSRKLENYFNDSRVEQGFDVSQPKIDKSKDREMLSLQKDYFEFLADVEIETRRHYIDSYRTQVRNEQEAALPNLEKEPEATDDQEGSPRNSIEHDHSKQSAAKSSSGEGNSTKTGKSRKPTSTEKIIGLGKRYKILPQIAVPVTSGNIKPKLQEHPRRKVPFLEADRIVTRANDVFSEVQRDEIHKIYRYRERDHRVLPAINSRVADEMNEKSVPRHQKRDTALKFRLALHPGTILKAPKLCEDVERILEMTEKRSVVESDKPEDEKRPDAVGLNGKFNDLLPKGAGDCNHLSLLLGVEDESQTDAVDSHAENDTHTDDETEMYRNKELSVSVAPLEAPKEMPNEMEKESKKSSASSSSSSSSMASKQDEVDKGASESNALPQHVSEEGNINVVSNETGTISENEQENQSLNDSAKNVEPGDTVEPVEREKSLLEHLANSNEDVAQDTAENEETKDEATSVESSVKDKTYVAQESPEPQETIQYSRVANGEKEVMESQETLNQDDGANNSGKLSPVSVLDRRPESIAATPMLADVDTVTEVDDADEVPKVNRRSSRRKRDEQHPNVTRLLSRDSSSSSALSRRSSNAEKLEYVEGNPEARSPIDMSGAQEFNQNQHENGEIANETFIIESKEDEETTVALSSRPEF